MKCDKQQAMHTAFIPGKLLLACLLVMAVMLSRPCPVPAQVLSVRHEIDVRLDLATKTLRGRDVVTAQIRDAAEIVLHLGSKVSVTKLELGGRPASYKAEDGVLRVPLPANARTGDVRLAVEYAGRFDDPWPENPHVFDNPGYGVGATITSDGAFFLAGSGWYPRLDARERSFLVTVRAPRGIYAVTSGSLIGHGDPEGESVSKWICASTPEELALFAGPFIQEMRRIGQIPVYTYFYPDSVQFSPVYLEAAARHLQFFSRLHGAYAFPKFAVVENFFPTGYGFPSFTLLGSQVLRLPFIPETSLRHEVAHCWWGNGVLVDSTGGNWSEGLTTYVADYLAKEQVSAEESVEYRRQILRDYALLAAGREDFPLRRFSSRISPASRAVGYGKAMFVFHMARRRVENRAFWQALRDVYAKRLFKPTSWEHFRDAFVAGGWDAAEAQDFFDQWLERTGAPRLRLGKVGLERMGARWTVRGELLQTEPYYDLHVPVRLQTTTFGENQLVHLSGPRAAFSFSSLDQPVGLDVDPEAHVFRQLAPEEIPVTVNSIKSAKALVAVLGGSMDEAYLPVLRLLLESLGQGGAEIIREKEVVAAALARRDVLFMGFPITDKGREAVASVQRNNWQVLEQLSQQETLALARSDAQLLAYADPERPGRVVAFFVPRPSIDMQATEEAARKITHYGKYSYLGFEKGVNTVKGIWEPQDSPLSVDFEEE